jgi:aminocarboxymuconate-semialdehyde decarboxylase
VDDQLARLWWDAHVGGPDALAVLAATFGTDHLLPGTNFAGWDSPDTDGPATSGPGEPSGPPATVGTGGPSGLGDRLDANARRFLRDRLP